MNKKILIAVGVVVVIVAAVVLCIWCPWRSRTVPSAASELISITKDGRLSTMDVTTGRISKIAWGKEAVQGFSGLPVFYDNATSAVDVSYSLFSKDQQEILIKVAERDKTKNEAFGGTYIIKSEKEYRCKVKDKTCFPSDLLAKANAFLFKEIGWPKPDAYPTYEGAVSVWFSWDSASDIFFGYPHGEGGPVFPVLIFNAKTGESDRLGLEGGINRASIDPLNKRMYVYDGSAGTTSRVSIYNLDGVHITFDKDIDIYTIVRPEADFDSGAVRNFVWNKQGTHLTAVGFTRVADIDIEKGTVTIVADAASVKSVLEKLPKPAYKDTIRADFSSGGRYVVYEQQIDENTFVIKAIDLKNGGQEHEVISGDVHIADYFQ